MIQRADFIDGEKFFDEHGDWMSSLETLEFLRDIKVTLSWMVADMKYRHDETFFQIGQYSAELRKAMDLLGKLERETQ